MENVKTTVESSAMVWRRSSDEILMQYGVTEYKPRDGPSREGPTVGPRPSGLGVELSELGCPETLVIPTLLTKSILTILSAGLFMSDDLGYRAIVKIKQRSSSILLSFTSNTQLQATATEGMVMGPR